MTKEGLEATKRILGSNRQYFLVLVSFVPIILWSYLIYGARALLLEFTAAAFCVLFHVCAAGFKKSVLRRKAYLFDLSPLISGFLLAFTLPHNTSIMVLVIGCAAAIAAKELSGGLGANIINPALFARVLIGLVFPQSTTLSLSFDTSSEMSGLEAVLDGKMPEAGITDMLFGRVDGNLGELSAWIIILCGLFLIVNKAINWRTPIAFIASAAAFSMFLAPESVSYPHYICGQLFCGGILICAVYFACDPVTSPHTNTGRLIFGAVCGALSVVVRVFFKYEGTYIVVLLAALWTPFLDRYLRPGVFGGAKAPKSANEATSAPVIANSKSQKGALSPSENEEPSGKKGEKE